MALTLLLIGELATAFFAAVVAGYVWSWIKAHRHGIQPYVGCRVRIRCGMKVYRSRLERIGHNVWTVSPPLARDEQYPIRRGETVIGEFILDDGTLCFRSNVSFADEFKGRIWIEKPRRTFYKRLPTVSTPTTWYQLRS